ncbi:sugar phosphate isomerase/epimerase [Micromonospora sp. HM5-17]|jgi:sugar phosphate isomerase/epimerase|uniref:sugar phosphate isomerase/epimerase family protein n=1 Tax=Micromonospora sp. HM5-17 TaxID=2487710 RepID=UPI000F48210D|nr:sugar phosphate isomerase/epimerase family protein [Micromonospora sp. HM5-17]ROT28128.1 sugar phosphate isomerase/epimerase [Micromonospora sp. HM5-17]
MRPPHEETPGAVPARELRPLRFGYGTNGFANHRLADALAVVADLGYEGVALTLDHDHLDPFAPNLARRTAELAATLDRLGLAVVVETGARYLLDPWQKHAPTLLHDDPVARLDFLRRAVRVGADLGAEAVSFWSGVTPPGVTDPWDRLIRGCAEIVEVAAEAGVPLGFEPEPGMLVEDIAGWRRLYAALGAPPGFGITLDIGHCRCLEPLSVPDCVREVGDHLVNVQIDDMRRGVHEHLEFGAGEIDFPPVLRALAEVGYAGLVAVELPRHSHAAPAVATRSIDFLRRAAASAGLPVTPRPPAPPDGPPAGPAAPSGNAGLAGDAGPTTPDGQDRPGGRSASGSGPRRGGEQAGAGAAGAGDGTRGEAR